MRPHHDELSADRVGGYQDSARNVAYADNWVRGNTVILQRARDVPEHRHRDAPAGCDDFFGLVIVDDMDERELAPGFLGDQLRTQHRLVRTCREISCHCYLVHAFLLSSSPR